MASTSSVQPRCGAEHDFIDLMIAYLVDRGYIKRDALNQFCPKGNLQPEPPVQDNKKDEYWKYIALHKAAVERDWAKKTVIPEDHKAVNLEKVNAVREAILTGGNRALHNMNELVEEMTIEDLEHENVSGETVLMYAVGAGNTRAAIILVEKHPRLLYIPDKYELLPVHVAATHDHKDTFEFLLSKTGDENRGVRPFKGKSGVRLVRQVIFSGYYDEALKLIDRYPELAKLQLPNGDSVLSAIALMESAFKSGSDLSFWEKAIYYCVPVKLDKYAKEVSQRLQAMLYKVLAFLVPRIKYIEEKKQAHYQAVGLVKLLCNQIATLSDFKVYESIVKSASLPAAKLGVKEVVEEILDSFPQAVFFNNEECHNVFQLAILHRQEKVFNIIHQMDPYKQILSQCLDKEENNMLHLVARLAPPSKLNRIPGAALQMQRELQWYKEVEKFVPPKYRLQKNNEGQTPAELFTQAHVDLVREGEEWMKAAAKSCTIVASLITTIAFAAAITGPGGNDNSTGLPIFSKKTAFIIFTISNALSLFTSTTSLLMFLSILTSRYEENDFLYVLPKRLIICLVTLFLSITTMMVAFTATLYLGASNYKEWILIPTTLVATVQIYIFKSLQFPLLLDLIYSTYGTIFANNPSIQTSYSNGYMVTVWLRALIRC